MLEREIGNDQRPGIISYLQSNGSEIIIDRDSGNLAFVVNGEPAILYYRLDHGTGEKHELLLASDPVLVDLAKVGLIDLQLDERVTSALGEWPETPERDEV